MLKGKIFDNIILRILQGIGHVPSFRSKKIFLQCPIPIVSAASLLFTLFPSPSRMTAFWSFTHEFRSRFVCAAAARMCIHAWVCASDTGGILISIQSRTISPALPLKNEEEGFFRESLSSMPMTPAGWASVAIFKCPSKSWENYVNRSDSHNMSRVTKTRKGGKKRKENRAIGTQRCMIRCRSNLAETSKKYHIRTIYFSLSIKLCKCNQAINNIIKWLAIMNRTAKVTKTSFVNQCRIREEKRGKMWVFNPFT